MQEIVMPIYEFKCLNCNEYMEILVLGSDDSNVEMKCAKCGCEELERILSSTSYAMGGEKAQAPSANTQTRTCSSGSCTTWNLPGHTR